MTGAECRIPVRVLIMGGQRSGTTLLVRLLGAQRGVSVRPGLLPYFFHKIWELDVGFADRLTARQRHVFFRAVRETWDASTLGPLSFGVDDFGTLDELHRKALAASGGASDEVVCHREHGPAGLLPDLLRATDVRVIYLVRDVRDIMVSRLFRGDQVLDPDILAWRYDTALAWQHRSHPRFAVLRYEELVTDPVATLRPVEELLERPIRTDFEAFDTPLGPWTQNSSFDDVARLFDPVAVGRWRQHWHEPLVRYASWACEDGLRRWAYDRTPGPGVAERLRFGRRWLTFYALWSTNRLRKLVLRTLLPPL